MRYYDAVGKVSDGQLLAKMPAQDQGQAEG